MPSKKMKRGPRHLEHDDYLTDPEAITTGPSSDRNTGTLGQRISGIRKQRKLSLNDLASRTGLDVQILEKVERDEYTPPLGELIRLGKALKMKMGLFLTPAPPKAYTIVRSHQRKAVARFASGGDQRKGYVYESLAPEKGDRMMEPFFITMHPSDIEEMSTHDGQEFIYVLEGKLEARIEDEIEVLEPGDAIYYNSNRPHMVRCHDDQVTRILAVLYTESK
jgi:quercetin dioxygenase-like cupin family protein/transcriptional regulator with XRE-family HTH domain